MATLQKERARGSVGDGINDSIALKKANVSISLRGASSMRLTRRVCISWTGLSELCDLRDIARRVEQSGAGQ